MTAARRDPVSVPFDRAARLLLDRAYKAGGGWAATRLADPTAAQGARWLLAGINVLGAEPRRDRDAQRAGSGFTVPNRWCRAFTRALWYQHKWFSEDPDTGGWRDERRTTMRWPGIEVEFGRHRQLLGIIPAGYPVRVRTASTAAAGKRGRGEKVWQWAEQGPRWADPAGRDWPALG